MVVLVLAGGAVSDLERDGLVFLAGLCCLTCVSLHSHSDSWTSPSACFDNPDQARVRKIPDTIADMPTLQPALLPQLTVDANHGLSFIGGGQIDMLPRQAEPIPDGDRQACGAAGESGCFGEPSQRNRSPDKWNAGFWAAMKSSRLFLVIRPDNGFWCGGSCCGMPLTNCLFKDSDMIHHRTYLELETVDVV